jgi:lipopolysaccharide transport system ATP-binding protein
MSDCIIEIDRISKLYRLGELGTGSLAHDFNRWWHRIRGHDDPYLKVGQKNDRARQGTNSDYVWALKDVSFNVRRGEVLGVIGRNGAGKSTLLKILSRVTRPTSGEIRVKGRTASLLEVGTGFHPELTGRENVHLNGAILGMARQEIQGKFDDIVEFSGCSAYIDTPVKRYSSGMKVRLGFAVAAYLNPDILVVDEVLAVGDAEFQKRCLGRMNELSHDGRSVIFVSHQMGLVRALCGRAVLMADGGVEAIGGVSEILGGYLSKHAAGDSFRRNQIEDKDLQITAVYASDAGDKSQIHLLIDVIAKTSRSASLDIRLKDQSLVPVGLAGMGSINCNDMLHFSQGTHRIEFVIETGCLANGVYVLSLDLTHPNVEYYDRVEDVLSIQIDQPPKSENHRVMLQSWGIGAYNLPLQLKSFAPTRP